MPLQRNPFTTPAGRFMPGAGAVHPFPRFTYANTEPRMFETYCNQSLPTDTSGYELNALWVDADVLASQIVANVTTWDAGIAAGDGEQAALLDTQVAVLMGLLGVVARRFKCDVDTETCAMAITAGFGPAGGGGGAGPTPHHALAALASASMADNAYLRGTLAQWLKINPDTFTPAELAEALRKRVNQHRDRTPYLARLWVGYAQLLNALGSSMAQATSELIAAQGELARDPALLAEATAELHAMREAARETQA